jgi:hypothetical protein
MERAKMPHNQGMDQENTAGGMQTSITTLEKKFGGFLKI